ncbi:YXWGXW repeat-containing protein [Candidatus Sumerlaeota bacterium]|nr:YXWGXW repeat-containing protein [Candidatus Sumerlaeota bacterium]
MKTINRFDISLIIVAAIIIMAFYPAPVAIGQMENQNSDSDEEILARGPVHEAFAQPGTYEAAKGVAVKKEPPKAIEEIPPLEKPEGDNVTWISGYWSWDEERDDYIWISGVWRIPPPGNSWVPGYWAFDHGEWRWTVGFWMSSESSEVEYLPTPPESLEIGPSSSPPSNDHIWSPGCWVWSGSYAWRPGYWIEARSDWVWHPAHYVWTVRGCVFVDGYWDFAIERRGVLFAPVYFHRRVRPRRYRVYTPSIVIQTSFLTASFFFSSHHHHFFFGDYYGDAYFRMGYHPWYAIHGRHRGYDPIFLHQRWHHRRTDRNWEKRLRDDYDYRRKHEEARPARTWSSQAGGEKRKEDKKHKDIVLAAPLEKVSKEKGGTIRFQKMDEEKRKTYSGMGKDLARLREEREKKEKSSAGKNISEPQKIKFSRSPVFGQKPIGDPGREGMPPGRPDAAGRDSIIHGKPTPTKGDSRERTIGPDTHSEQKPTEGKSKTPSDSGKPPENREKEPQSREKSRESREQNKESKGKSGDKGKNK